ncbi:MAG: xanthine dehydrogenase family protein molybdopterin-binding subunit [Elusimicrobia bacterium]|nr:xanthine dehydrogenase family protein molybdopterin-binding subunit [Elusimicrobiota bacterium]
MARPSPVQVGIGVNRTDAPQKLTGAARFIDDYKLPGCLHAATLRTAIAHGRIKKITFDPSFPWHQFAIARAADIPGLNNVLFIEQDQPLLTEDKVLHPMQPILIVGHPDRAQAYQALKHIAVEYEEEEPVLSIEDSLAKKRLLRGEDNIFKKFLIEKGNLDEGFSRADRIVEGEYRVPHQEQAYIENHGMAAWVEGDGTIVVHGSLQCPYYVHKALVKIFNRPPEKIRVISAFTGGAFGGKEDYPSLIAGHAALLALKSGKPVKLIYDRAEDMAATTKRHPAIVRHKTGVSADGRLLAQDITLLMDGGAFATCSGVVLSRGTLHATGPYECPNVRVRSCVLATNTPPNGAFRGFGVPQAIFAAELQMEKIAATLGLSSLELRRRNAWKVGSITSTGQELKESVGASKCLELCVKKARYDQKRKAHARWNRDPGKPTWRGIGLALCHHGAGFTGSGEVTLASRAAVSLTKDGGIKVLAASTDLGQGAGTIFTQIAAHALALPPALIQVEVPDTALVPNSGPTVASRTTMVIGRLIERAAGQLKLELVRASGRVPQDRAGLKRAAKLLCNGQPARRFEVQYEKPADITWDDNLYRGEAYGVFSYAAVAVDLEVDRLTYEVKLRRVTTAQDIGKAINPTLAKGQIMGGTNQALGWALLEYADFRGGWMRNSQFTNYLIPTFADSPPMDVFLVEEPYSRGPYGAKGLGEMPMDLPAPAVVAAVRDATGFRFHAIPIRPEDICAEFLKAQRPL